MQILQILQILPRRDLGVDKLEKVAKREPWLAVDTIFFEQYVPMTLVKTSHVSSKLTLHADLLRAI